MWVCIWGWARLLLYHQTTEQLLFSGSETPELLYDFIIRPCVMKIISIFFLLLDEEIRAAVADGKPTLDLQDFKYFKGLMDVCSFVRRMHRDRDSLKCPAEQSHHAPQQQRSDSGAELWLWTPRTAGGGCWESLHGTCLSDWFPVRPQYWTPTHALLRQAQWTSCDCCLSSLWLH